MSQAASRVIGIIRISESREIGAPWSAGSDDSSLGAVLAGLVGKPSCRPRGGRWETAAQRRYHSTCRVPANLAALRRQLEREYVALTAG